LKGALDGAIARAIHAECQTKNSIANFYSLTAFAYGNDLACNVRSQNSRELHPRCYQVAQCLNNPIKRVYCNCPNSHENLKRSRCLTRDLNEFQRTVEAVEYGRPMFASVHGVDPKVKVRSA